MRLGVQRFLSFLGGTIGGRGLLSCRIGSNIAGKENWVVQMRCLLEAARGALEGIDYRHGGAVLLFSDSEEGLSRCRETVEAARCRVSAAAGAEVGAERLARQVSADAVMVEVEQDYGAALDELVAAMAEGAGKASYGGILIAPAAVHERMALDSGAGIHRLVEPTAFDRLVALRSAVSRRASRFHDIKGQAAPRLQQLSEEVGRIATMLAALSEEEAGATPDAEGLLPVDASFVRSIIRARRMRDQFFKSDLFADPAWDMLLDLFAARLEDREVAVSSLCIAAAVPSTTALRWIKTLSDQGLFVRTADPGDGRRVFIRLSDEAAAGMEAYLKAAQRISTLAI